MEVELEFPSAPDGSFVFHPCRILVWKNAKYETPDLDKPLLCLTKNGKLQTFAEIKSHREWYWKAEKYNLEYWCYQEELQVK